MSKAIAITVKAGGKIEVKAEGYAGSGCETAVAYFAAKLGGKTEADEHTLDYYQAAEQGPATQEVQA